MIETRLQYRDTESCKTELCKSSQPREAKVVSEIDG
jgi:hypothetical protein